MNSTNYVRPVQTKHRNSKQGTTRASAAVLTLIATIVAVFGLLPAMSWAQQTPIPIKQLQRSDRSERAFSESILHTEAPRIGSQLHGIARPHREASLCASFARMVEKTHVTAGQKVKAGTPLLTLEGQADRAALALAELEANQTASVSKAELALKHSFDQLQRAEQAYERDQQASSNERLQAIRDAHEQATVLCEMQIEQQAMLQAKLKIAQAAVAALVIRAPFDGQVLQIHAQQGNLANPNKPALTFASLDRLRVELHLPLETYGKIKLDSRHELSAGAPVLDTISGIVVFVSPIVESTSGTYRCIIEVENPGHKLPAGFQVRLKPRDQQIDPNAITAR